MPLEPPVINAARSANSLSFSDFGRSHPNTRAFRGARWPFGRNRRLNNMRPVLRSRVAIACVALLGAALLAAGCGGSDSSSTSSSSAGSHQAPPKSDFPSASGKTLAQVLDSTSGPSQLVVSPASQVFHVGENRYSFGVFQRDRTQVPDAQVALYFAHVPPSDQTTLPRGAGNVGKGQVQGAGGNQESTPPPKKAAEALDQPDTGPFPAQIETLETKPAFRTQTTANDPDTAMAVYITHFDCPANGNGRNYPAVYDS